MPKKILSQGLYVTVPEALMETPAEMIFKGFRGVTVVCMSIQDLILKLHTHTGRPVTAVNTMHTYIYSVSIQSRTHWVTSVRISLSWFDLFDLPRTHSVCVCVCVQNSK